MDSNSEGSGPVRNAKLVHELFEEHARLSPNATALIHADRHFSYAQLNARANQLARYLTNQGIEPDELIGICVERSIEMVIGLLGVLKAGGACMPLDPEHPPALLAQILRNANPRFVLSQQELVAMLPDSSTEIIELDLKLREIDGRVSENLSPTELGLSPQDRVYAIHVPHSTVTAEPAEMTHASMLSLVEWHTHIADPRNGQRVLQFSALSIEAAFEEILSTLCTGNTLVLVDEWIRRDMQALAEFLTAYRIEKLFCPSLFLQQLTEYAKENHLASLALRDVIVVDERSHVTTTSLMDRPFDWIRQMSGSLERASNTVS